MIVFIYGTTAEAIKLAPIMRRLDRRGVPYQQWVTFQHTDALRAAQPELGLRRPDRVIADGWRGRPLKKPIQMLGWMAAVGGWTFMNLGSLRRAPRPGVVIVHGDTMTTVLGTFIGRLSGLPVAHVEAGLRSGDWRHPFPEELDRRIVGRLAAIHYAPTPETAANLAGRADVIVTHGNTVKDAVRDSAAQDGRTREETVPYGLVLLHRFEFISNASLVTDTLKTLDANTPVGLKVVVDSYSRDTITRAIADLGLTKLTVTAKQEHSAFVTRLRGASLVVTDSGGVQEEAAVFGIPTLIHRMATERSEGLGTSALLSRWDQDVVRSFLENADAHRAEADARSASPSDIIVDDLIARGFARPA
ncbi:UDP-N-acetylglucosamine 2-epimerase [Microbacterium proteolyticum]|uniref:UDP-N-acetylglucosamine 2-epimerase n=1 Tax=Microbacterium proteolyticum TaxID=1572644 RepID=UPI001FAE1949|nr:UDP-N-acetylglucosamine 2-epimerase [Microbacterium proteolyticum]MCI9857704.1 UDP-N-acetylglucosamine 2-epimerase [Microbacterium proteolyticum]